MREGPPMDADFWDEEYRRDPESVSVPDRLLADALADLTPGTALCLGCGDGRNALVLARRGWWLWGWTMRPPPEPWRKRPRRPRVSMPALASPTSRPGRRPSHSIWCSAPTPAGQADARVFSLHGSWGDPCGRYPDHHRVGSGHGAGVGHRGRRTGLSAGTGGATPDLAVRRAEVHALSGMFPPDDPRGGQDPVRVALVQAEKPVVAWAPRDGG